MSRMRVPLLAGVLLLPLTAASCARCDRSGDGGAPAAASASASASAAASDAGPAARCTVVGAPRLVGALAGEDAAATEGPVAFGAEIGGAIADKAFVVGLRAAGLNGAAQILELSFDGGPPHTLATLPASPGSAPAPLLAGARDGARLVGTLAIAADARTFRLSRLGEDGALSPLGEVAQSKDESEATAVIAGAAAPLVAWDDVDEKARLGRIRARLLDPTGKAPEAKPKNPKDKDAGDDEDSLSPSSSDAAWPELAIAPSGDRAALVWLSERPESELVDAGGGEPSQLLAYRWVEAVVVDLATGKRLSTSRALTALDGHAQTFSVIWGDAGLVLAVRDDARPTDGDGGELWAVRVPIDASGSLLEPARTSIADKDVAPGVAALLPRPSGALVSWLAADGTARLSPAFSAGSATVEPALRDRRVLSVHGDRVLASRLSGSGVELVVARCEP